MINKKELCFYRVDNFMGFSPFLVPSSLTLCELIKKINKDGNYSEFQIFIDSQLIENALINIKLQEIVKKRYHSQNSSPTFYILELHQSEESSSCLQAEYQAELAELLKLQGDTRTEWIGANGHTLYDGRSKALLASSFKQSSTLHKSNSTYLPYMQQCMRQDPTIFKGKISSEINQIKEMISRLQKDTPAITASKQYSNFDLNFVTSLQRTYLKYMLLSGGRLSYVDYKQMPFGVIERRIGPDDRVGIIGDYGTGLPDSFELLDNMIMGEGVNIVLHLGDVYYAGTPQEYERNITGFLRTLRKRAKRDIYFYSIPGNHDYYSWGAPFLCFVKEINEQEPTKQRASYFCLRTWDDKWQFLGADSAYHDSNPLDQLNKAGLGPRLRARELAWHKQKLQSFPGSTILLTHHQLFSTRDRLCGSLSKYRAFSCINPVLHKQLFEYLPYLSAWFWGHQHAFMLFKYGFWGLPMCRLLGNSSFHVLQQQEHPYARHKGFPVIPYIQQDQPYMKKYLPISPSKQKQPYFHLTFAVIDGKQSTGNIRIKYYCSPSYSESSKKATHFKYYLLHQQTIISKHNIITSAQPLRSHQQILLKHEIGLTISSTKQALQLNLKGSIFQIRLLSNNNNQQQSIIQQIPILLYCGQGYLSSNSQGKLQLLSIPSDNSKWTLKKHRVFNNQAEQIRFIDSFSIKNLSSVNFLGITLSFGQAHSILTTIPQLWSALSPSAGTTLI